MVSENKKYLILLSIVFPFLGFILACKNFFVRNSQFSILFFSFWFGYMVVFNGGDIVSYHEAFPELISYSFDDFWHLIVNSLNEDKKYLIVPENVFNSKPDIFALSLGFLVSRFTENERWFFALVSLIYTYFSLKFFQEVFKFTGRSNTKLWKLLLLFLITIVPFYVGVTGVRFWVALFLYMFLLMRYVNTGKMVYFVLVFTTVLIHYTFLFPILILAIVIFIPIPSRLMRILVLIALVYYALSSSTNIIGSIQESLSYFGDSVSSNAEAYTDQEDIAARNAAVADANWYVKFRGDIITYFFIGIFAIDYFGLVSYRKDKLPRLFEKLYLLFFIIAMLTNGLGSLSRFIYVFYLISIIRLLWLCNYNESNALFLKLPKVLFPILMLHILVVLRSGLYFVDPVLLFGNPIVYLYIQSGLNVSEILVGH